MTRDGRPERRKTFLGVVGAILTFLLGVFTGPVVTAFANEYLPVVIEPLRHPTAVVAVAGYDSSTFADGYAMSLPTPFSSGAISLTPVEGPLPWLHANSAAVIGDTPVLLTVTGERDSGIVIRGMRAVVINREKPYAGTRVSSASAGDQAVPEVSVDLDEASAIARDESGHPYFSSTSFTLSKNESESFLVVASTKKSACSWQIVLDLVVDGARTSYTVPTVFHTSAEAASYKSDLAYRWDKEPRVLEPAQDQ